MKTSSWAIAENESEIIITEDDSSEPEFRAGNFKPGIYFRDLVNRRAFVDRIVLSIGGKPIRPPSQRVNVSWDKGIKGKKSNYARVKTGSILLTGNPYNLKYGKTKTFQNIPDCQLTLRSEQEPVTGAHAHHAVKALIEGSPRAIVSEVEMTFDVDDWSIEKLHMSITSRAEHHAVKETLYIGKRKSNWQVCLYPKADIVARLEFILRRQFLKSCGIEGIDDILELKAVDVWDKIRIQVLNKAAFKENVAALKVPEWKKETILYLARKQDLQGTKELLLKGYGREVMEASVVDATIQPLLEKMHKAFLW